MNPKGFIKTLDHTYSRSRRESSWSRFGPLSRCWQHKIRKKLWKEPYVKERQVHPNGREVILFCLLRFSNYGCYKTPVVHVLICEALIYGFVFL